MAKETIKPNEKFNSGIGILKILAEKDGWKQKVELWLLNSEVNRNNWQYLNLEEHKNLFAETPILIAYKGDQLGDGHNFETVKLPNGQVAASFMGSTSERPVGFFPTNAEMRIEELDGKQWIVGVGWIWKWYAQELVAHLKKQGLEGMSISIETLIDEMYMNGDTEVFTKYQILGTTILHETVQPAVADARIRALSALGIDKIREETLRVASMYQETKEKNPQTKTNKEKQTIMNKKSLKDNFKGFQVIEVVDGKVALLSCDKHEPYIASVTKDESGIVEGAKNNVNATVVFGEGDNAVKVALDSVIEDIIGAAKTENEELKNQVADKEQTIRALSEANEKMKTQETSRRKTAVENAIKNRFDEIKANSEANFEGNECDELKSEERVNSFVLMEDKDGKFIGDKEAVKAVDAVCMDKIIEANKTRVNSQKKSYVWDKANGADDEQKHSDEIDSAIAEFSEDE